MNFNWPGMEGKYQTCRVVFISIFVSTGADCRQSKSKTLQTLAGAGALRKTRSPYQAKPRPDDLRQSRCEMQENASLASCKALSMKIGQPKAKTDTGGRNETSPTGLRIAIARQLVRSRLATAGVELANRAFPPFRGGPSPTTSPAFTVLYVRGNCWLPSPINSLSAERQVAALNIKAARKADYAG